MRLFLDKFAENVLNNPDKAAIVDGDKCRATTYEELDKFGNKFAAWYEEKGIKKGQAVMVAVSRRMEYFAAELGAWKHGNAVVPVSCDYPKERIDVICNDCKAVVVITDADIDEVVLKCSPEAGYYEALSPEDISFITYTSGSTGTPKGIFNYYGNMSFCIGRYREVYTPSQDDVFMSNAPLNFVGTLQDFLYPLYEGLTVYLLTNETRSDIRKIEGYIKDNGITMAFLSPQMLRLYRDKGSKLKKVLTGSERITGFENGNYTVYNAYGLSEACGPMTAYPMSNGFEENMPVGKALSGYKLFILDEEGKKTAAGEIGEICISGPVAGGYLNMPEQTAKVFEGNPPLLHTGDMGRLLPDGNIVYVNRKDWMIKINGQRVETGEAEATLMKIDGITNAVVKGFEGASGQNYLCAYYTGEPHEESELKQQLAKTLPGYMIPSFFVHMEKLPVNANGKLDRKALHEPNISANKESYKGPSNDVEKRVCAAFEQVLKCGHVGVNDSFFALGGNSINVLPLIEACGIEGMAPQDIFAAKTPGQIAKIALNLEKTPQKKATKLYSHITDKKDFYALTDSQMGVYLECIANPDSTMYNIPHVLKASRDGIDADRLAEAVSAAVNNHPALHVHFEYRGDDPAMVPYPPQCDAEVTILPEAKVSEYVKSFVRPFDIENDALYRIEILCSEQNIYLLTDVHHLVFDGSSVEILLNDIAHAYDTGNTDFENEEITIFDISAAEEKITESESYKEGMKFFEEKLAGIDTGCELISDSMLEKTQKGGAFFKQVLLSDMKQEEIDSFLKKNEITENTLFMTAFAYALAKYSGQNDALFCSVNNGRHESGLEKTAGMLVRTLPLTFRIDEESTAVELLHSIQELFLETMSHDVCRFSELAHLYGIASNIMFVYQSDMLNGVEIGGNMFEAETTEVDPQADLSVIVYHRDGYYEAMLEYRTELYSKELICDFSDSMNQVLYGLMSGRRMKEVSLMSSRQTSLIEQFNATEQPFDRSLTVVDLFREQVRRNPDNTAVIYHDVTLTYRELDDVTERLAQYISSLGLGREDVVSILVSRSQYMPICSLGVLKAGAAYEPLDPSYPVERLQFMMKDAGSKLLIADEELVKLVPAYEGKILLTSDISGLPRQDIILTNPKPGDLFVMLYTSGTTGVPKGCMLEHGNVAAVVNWYIRDFNLTEESIATAYASFGFDANILDTYPSLCCGAGLVIIGDDMRLDLAEIDRYMDRLGITHSLMTTQVGRQMAIEAQNKSLKYLAMGGEKLVPFVPSNDIFIGNMYGPSECTVLCTCFNVNDAYRDIPIGKPISNIKIYIADKYGRMLPAGVPGELCISGYQVSRGYLNRPEQTQKAYTENPFCDKEGYERLYHTGDVCRYLQDGNIQFIGRRDAQVKIRGFRIELTEVEQVIRQFEGIKDATVVAYDDSSGGKYIAAYVVSDEPVSVEALDEFILSQKPPYMVPAVTMQIERIPLNQNQKVNKRALPVPQRKIENVIPPENEYQQKIFDIIAEVIGHREFGINTDIYLAGLTSIGAVKLNLQLARAFDSIIKANDLKENSTVQKLETFLKGASSNETYVRQADYPLTQTQSGVFVECMAHPDSIVYNIPVLLRLEQSIDLDRLEAAVLKTVEAHPYVKTRLFMNEEGDIRQRRLDEAEGFTVERITKEKLEDDTASLIKPFKILGGSLIRVKLIEAEAKYLFLETHHVISDGTSLNIFLGDISRAYLGESLEKETFSGFEQSLAEEEARSSRLYLDAKAYYEGLFGGYDAECLPVKTVQEGAETGKQAGSIEVYGKYSSSYEVKDYCKENKVTMNAFFTAAFGVLISKFCRKDDAIFTTIYNGRNDSRLANSVCMLVKTYPVICQTGEKDKKIADLVASMQKQLMDSMSYDIYSFAEIKRGLGINADIMFAYQGSDFVFDELCGKPAAILPVEFDVAKAPLNVNVFIENDKIKYIFEYQTAMFDEEIMACMMDAFDMTVSELLHRENMNEISILSPEAREKMDGFNDTRADVEDITVSKLFERQVAKTPERMAVICAGESLTFEQLNKRANRVGNSLISLGVKPDTIVALMLHRSVDVYALREGILKSGGAFLSLEADYPDERVSYILENSKAPQLITTRDIYQDRREFLDGLDIHVVFLDELYKCENIQNPVTAVKPHNLAYCIYTSGSTGKPKGVMIEQHNLVNMLNYCDNNILAKDYVDNTSVFLGLAAITFDVSVIEEMMPMYHGQTTALATEEEIHNPIMLAQMMLAVGVDMMKCTPSYMQTIMDFPDVQKALQKLNAIIIGAEAFPRTLYQKMRDIGMNCRIFNSYGPTETTVSVTIDELDGKAVTIGCPANNVRVLMLDKYDHVLPQYAQGELTITGNCVGRGYVGLQKQTAEKFIELEGERAYRSGDIAYWNRDGKIEFCGRSDNQVKLRGLRVELDEIENTMNTYPGVKRSIVLVKENPSGQFLCGYFTAVDTVDQAKLTQHLGKTLTNYMIPGVFVQLEQFPMNQNGKVDRKALPEPVFEQKNAGGRMPTTELQKKLCGIFEMAIGIDGVGIDDDFFEMGGTSLSASKVAMKCMTENIPIVYADIFKYATVEKLEAFVLEKQGAGAKAAIEDAAGSGVAEEALQVNEMLRDSDAVKKVLEHNTLQYLDEIEKSDIGNVLLTGSTGFLGMHVLSQLIQQGRGNVLCLVRKGKNRFTPEKRLKTTLMYYFEDTFDDLFGSRITVVEGDITDENLKETLAAYEFDTVINCAACVKHFVKDDLLDRVNVEGVKNLITVCKERDTKLIQVSTVSVAGEGRESLFAEDKVIRENEHDFGQILDNKYVETKYLAEQAVLEAVADGMRGKIVRVGNLMSRYKDGEFQLNYPTNGFMSRLKGIAAVGKFAVNNMDSLVEFSPIDYTAKALVMLAGTGDEFTIFHAYNCHHVHMANVIDAMNKYGITVDVVKLEEYQKAFEAMLEDESKNMKVSGMVSYDNQDKTRFFVGSDNSYSTRALYRLGFSWPIIDKQYLEKAITALATLGFFDN